MTAATLINGRAIADAMLDGLASELSAIGSPLHLAAVCAGDEAGVRAFVKLKQKAAQSVGVQFSSYVFDADDESGARQTVAYLTSDDSVHGIFIELPLPAVWDAAGLLQLIPVSKDVDVLTDAAQDAFYRGADGALLPPAVRALRAVCEMHHLTIAGIRAAVIGAGVLVGKPVAAWLRREGAVVEVIDVDTPAPQERSRTAELIVAATGVPGLVTADWVRAGATVIDFGYGRKGTVYVGDVDADSVQKKAGLLTPVPGGMGPLVIASVLENLLDLAVR